MDRAAALHLLEGAVQRCRFGKPVRTDDIKQALRSLLTPATKRHTVEFWDALDSEGMWRFSSADNTLASIYRILHVERDGNVAQAIWARLYEERITPEMRRARGG